MGGEEQTENSGRSLICTKKTNNHHHRNIAISQLWANKLLGIVLFYLHFVLVLLFWACCFDLVFFCLSVLFFGSALFLSSSYKSVCCFCVNIYMYICRYQVKMKRKLRKVETKGSRNKKAKGVCIESFDKKECCASTPTTFKSKV